MAREEPQSAKTAQGFGHEAGATLTRHNDNEEEGEDMTEEDPLEWAYSMTHVPKIEVLVTQEVKHTVEADRQDDTQSRVSVPTKKARESWVVQSG